MASLECPVFQATHRDITTTSFAEFVEKHEKDFAEFGVCKIVPPRGWKPRKEGYTSLNFTIPRPIRQHAAGRQGVYRTILVEEKCLTLKEFKAMATDPSNAPPPSSSSESLDRKYWRSIALNPPLYGADVPGSLFDEEVKGWNLRGLESLLSRTMAEHGVVIPGVNSPYLYVGSWRSTFAWHTEDVDLHSVNYLHFGAPKTWYVVPPAHRQRFERLVQGMLPDLFRACPEFLRHKELVVSPSLLAQHNIPVVRLEQQPGDFVVTYPGAYHCGFNQGFNCAESVNFATKAWVDIGAVAGSCECRQDTVRMDMRMFAEHMSPELREEWLAQSSEESEGSGSEESDSEASEEEGEEEECASDEEGASEGQAGSGSASVSSKEGSLAHGGCESEESEEEEEGGRGRGKAAAKRGASGRKRQGPAAPPQPPKKRRRAAQQQRAKLQQQLQEESSDESEEEVEEVPLARGSRRKQVKAPRAAAAAAAAPANRRRPDSRRPQAPRQQQQAGLRGGAAAATAGSGHSRQQQTPRALPRSALRPGTAAAAAGGKLAGAAPSPSSAAGRAQRLLKRMERRGEPVDPRSQRRHRREQQQERGKGKEGKGEGAAAPGSSGLAAHSSRARAAAAVAAITAALAGKSPAALAPAAAAPGGGAGAAQPSGSGGGSSSSGSGRSGPVREASAAVEAGLLQHAAGGGDTAARAAPVAGGATTSPGAVAGTGLGAAKGVEGGLLGIVQAAAVGVLPQLRRSRGGGGGGLAAS